MGEKGGEERMKERKGRRDWEKKKRWREVVG